MPNVARSAGNQVKNREESYDTAVARPDDKLSIACLDIPFRGLRMNHE